MLPLALASLLLAPPRARGQPFSGFFLPEKSSQIRIPFTLLNRLIVVEVSVNGNFSMNFILDTGVNVPILIDPAMAQLLGLELHRKFLLQVPGIRDSVVVHASSGNLLRVGKKVVARNMFVVVMDEQDMEFLKILGQDIDGILGYDLFREFVVKINYQRQHLVLYRHEKFKPSRCFTSLPLVIHNGKPMVEITFDYLQKPYPLQMLVDTGANHILLFNARNTPFVPPSNNSYRAALGYGLGGVIEGRISRFGSIEFAGFSVPDPIISLPDTLSYRIASLSSPRNGSLGNYLLSKFHLVFDYAGETLYLKKNNSFRDAFQHDRSGLQFIWDEESSRAVVSRVIGDSPAHLAGLCEGDVVSGMNGSNYSSLTLGGIHSMLMGRRKKQIILKIIRDDLERIFRFRLDDYI